MKTKLLLIAIACFLSGSLYSQIIHVPADQPTIQSGIIAATTGDTVLVADGSYLENINYNGKAITVASHFLIDGDTNHINNTVIDGSLAGNFYEASVITLDSGEDTTSVINGFTVTGGQGSWSEMFSVQAGGGILCVNAGVKIMNCKIIDNRLQHEDALGGGISCMVSNGDFHVIIKNNIISGNEAHAYNFLAAGGGIFILAATPAANVIANVNNNEFYNNYCENVNGRADGGAVRIEIATMATATYNIHSNIFQNNSINGASSSRGGALCGIGTGANIHNNIFRYNSIHENSGQFRGAAICFKNSTTDINIYKNNFVQNNSPIEFEDCTGAVSILDAWEHKINIDGNLFLNNEACWGAGLYVRRGYKLSVTNNVYWQNAACGGGCISLYNPVNDKNNYHLGGEYVRAGIVNNTFAHNTSSEAGGAIRFTGEHTPPVIFNSIFFNNVSPDGPDIFNATDQKITISFSRIDVDYISGPYGGDDNITEDPYLLAGDSSCHLSWQSPCIGAGTPELEFTDTTYSCPDHDYDGELRPMCNLVDIGADETPFWVGLHDHHANRKEFQLTISPNPSTTKTNIQYTIKERKEVSLILLNMQGGLVESIRLGEKPAGDHRHTLNLSHLPDGIYLLRLQAGEQVETAKVILLK